MDEIKVRVYRRKGRKHYEAKWTDPLSGKVESCTTKCERKRDAERFAGKLAAELNDGRYKRKLKVTWEEFRNRYEDEKLSSLADKTAEKVWAAFNAVEELIGPKLLQSLDAGQISRFQTLLRTERKVTDSTIKGHLRHLRASLNWAVSVELLASAPKIEMPARAKESKLMKGRPITAEEFDRMLEKVESVTVLDSSLEGTLVVRFANWRGDEPLLGPNGSNLRRHDGQVSNALDTGRYGKGKPGSITSDRA